MDAMIRQQQRDRWQIFKWVVLFLFLPFMVPSMPSDRSKFIVWHTDALFGLVLLVFIDMWFLLLGSTRRYIQTIKKSIVLITAIYIFLLTFAVILSSNDGCLQRIGNIIAGLVIFDMWLLLHVQKYFYIRIFHITTMLILTIALFSRISYLIIYGGPN